MPKVADIEIPDTDIWTTLFERKDKPFPDTQVIYHDPTTSRQYTYSTLRDTAASFGSYLQSVWKWQKGDVLAQFAQNDIDTPAITWGVHWAGGVVSPANPAYTVRELVHHLKDSGAKALFTQKSLLSAASEAAREAGIPPERVILLGDRKAVGVGHFSQMIESGRVKTGKRVKIEPKKDLSFLVYSSGTTGLPKGVMLSHSNVVSNLFMLHSAEKELLRWDKHRVLSVLPYYHIYGLLCLIHAPAYTGVTTVVMSSFDLNFFCKIIQDYKITYTYVAPPIVLHLAKSQVVENYDLSSLKTITSGAAPLTKDLIYKVKERLGTEVKQAYGMSEASPATYMQIKWDHGIGSNGPALPNQTIKFMSPDGVEVAQGKEGELYIKGPNIFLGYHNNPAATKSSLTSDGFYKTGDIGYEDQDGNMYITDRVKELIKYKGFQVAPAELEGLLMGCDLVEDCAVIGVFDKEKETEVPMAFVVLREGEIKDGKDKEIIDWLNSRVAAHKRLRGGVRFIQQVPKSASGKILRRILKDDIKREMEGSLKAKL